MKGSDFVSKPFKARWVAWCRIPKHKGPRTPQFAAPKATKNSPKTARSHENQSFADRRFKFCIKVCSPSSLRDRPCSVTPLRTFKLPLRPSPLQLKAPGILNSPLGSCTYFFVILSTCIHNFNILAVNFLTFGVLGDFEDHSASFGGLW